MQGRNGKQGDKGVGESGAAAGSREQPCEPILKKEVFHKRKKLLVLNSVVLSAMHIQQVQHVLHELHAEIVQQLLQIDNNSTISHFAEQNDQVTF